MGGGKGYALSFSASSMPSIPGMRKSVRTTTGPSSVGGSASNACPEANGRARYPADFSSRSNAPRTDSSSSTTHTIADSFMASPSLRLHGRHAQLDYRAALATAAGPDVPAVCLDKDFRRPAYVRRGAGPGSAQPRDAATMSEALLPCACLLGA